MKRYPEYKSSGVLWLGDIPEHWEGKRLRDCVEGCLNGVWGDEPDGGEDDIPVIRVADFDRPKRRVVEYETVRKIEKAQRSGRTLSAGDMLIEKSGGGEQQPVGMVVSYLGPDGAVCSNFVARMTPREGVFSRFMVYLHAHYYAAKVAYISIKQTTGIQNLDSMAYLSETCFIPPLPEQEAIASYLDAETARIDSLIAEKEDLINLLKEWRQSVIAEAVTKGLNKSVTMKASGVPWLGDIPDHWDVRQLRHAMDGLAMNGIFKRTEDFGEGVPLVNVSDLFTENYSINIESLEKVVCSVDEVEKFKVEVGDLFLVRSSLKLEGIAKFAVVRELNEPAVFECHVVRIKPNQEIMDGVFLSYFLNSTSVRQSLVSRAKTTTMTTIDQNEALSTLVLIPDLDEQKAIAGYLDKESVRIDRLVTHTTEEIELLKELRTATIADAVLGRVKVF